MENRTVAIVTGASGEIGAAITDAFSEDGFRVCALGFEHSPKAPPNGFAMIGDLRDEKVALEAARACKERWGRIDALVNCAGITKDNFLERMSTKGFTEVMEVNVLSAFNMCKAVLPLMKMVGRGHIVNIGSIVSEIGGIGCSAYVASKGALASFSRALALETAKDGIFVNTLLLGYIDAGLCKRIPEGIRQKIEKNIPLGRFGDTSEVIKAVLYLAETNYMTGAALRLSGGL